MNEWREVARDTDTLKKASERTVDAVKLEASARCEGAGLDRPVKEIANLALKAGGRGAMGLDMRVCPKCGDTLHPSGLHASREEMQWHAQELQHLDA